MRYGFHEVRVRVKAFLWVSSLFFSILYSQDFWVLHIFIFIFKTLQPDSKKPRKRMSHSSVHKRRKESAPLPHLATKGVFLFGHPFDFLGLNAFLSRFALRCTYKTPLKTLLLINLVILQFQNCFLWKQPMRYLSLSSHNK